MTYTPRPDIVYEKLLELRGLVQQVLTQSPLGYSSITEGSLRVASNEGLIVEGSAKVSGWLVVTGTGRFVGRLEGSGTLDWTGPWYLRGPGQIAGDASVTGAVTVEAGGRVVIAGANPITLEQSGGVAHMLMGESEIRGGDGGVGIYPAAGPSIIMTAAGLRIAFLPEIAGTGLPAGALHVDAFGFVRRADGT